MSRPSMFPGVTQEEADTYDRRHKELTALINSSSLLAQAQVTIFNAMLAMDNGPGMATARNTYHTQMDVLFDAQVEQKRLTDDMSAKLRKGTLGL